MVNQLLLWAAENSRLEKFVADNPLASKTVQRFVAGHSCRTRYPRRST